jgi:spermidine/putrescine transport system ATP-binding protein
LKEEDHTVGEAYAVELESVAKVFGNVTAVNNVSLRIRDGEFYSLLGPSGCGKTTTLRLIAGFEMPTQGQIRIYNKPMGDTPAFKRPVNTVFQSYALFPHMTVGQNVAFGLEMKKVPKDQIKQRVEKTLAMVRLPGFADRRPNQLSGGQQQRVALARALVNQPEVLLLDEPLGALDLILRKMMQLELKQLQQEVGITFVYVTHDQVEALTMSDRIAVMNEGRVLQVGSPVEIYERPRSRFVADFIGETNFLEGVVDSVDGEGATVLIDGRLPVRAVASGDVLRGQSVSVAVRPERVTLLPAGADGFPGRVAELIYAGVATRYHVQLTERSQVVVLAQNLTFQDARPFDQGDEVTVSWDADSALVLTE